MVQNITVKIKVLILLPGKRNFSKQINTALQLKPTKI
jgi:hypothetical protein